MRILHIITSLRTGGAERLVTELALRLDGDDVAVLLFDGTRTPFVEKLERNGIPVFSLGMGAKAMHNPFILWRLRHFLRKRPYDILHTHNTSCQFLSALVPHQARITTEHNTTNRRRSWPWFRPIDRWMYGRYQAIVCVGEETKIALARWLNKQALAEKMTMIPNGIDLQRFRNAKPEEGPTPTAGFTILMVAAFRPQKDHATLIRALSLLPDEYQLKLAGGFETTHDHPVFSACRNLARELKLENRIRFLGVRTDIPELMAACHVVVLSSVYEGFGLAALEGMASGKPVIASDVDGLRDLVGGAGLLVPPGDPQALAKAIREVCERPSYARELGQKCRERAQQYDIDETVQKYRQLYGEIAASRSF